jgi:hypothetical protein
VRAWWDLNPRPKDLPVNFNVRVLRSAWLLLRDQRNLSHRPFPIFSSFPQLRKKAFIDSECVSIFQSKKLTRSPKTKQSRSFSLFPAGVRGYDGRSDWFGVMNKIAHQPRIDIFLNSLPVNLRFDPGSPIVTNFTLLNEKIGWS